MIDGKKSVKIVNVVNPVCMILLMRNLVANIIVENILGV
jgi:hypothetical protein